MSLFEPRDKRLILVKLYREWVVHNLFYYSFAYNFCSVIAIAILIPTDRAVLGEQWPLFYPGRLLTGGANLMALILLVLSSKSHSNTRKDIMNRISIFVPGLVWNFVYYYYLCLGLSKTHFDLMLGGSYAVILFSNFLLHRFSTYQYALTFSSIIGLWIMNHLHIMDQTTASQLIIANAIFAPFMIMFRREYVSGIFDRYKSLCMIVPEKLAHFLVVQRKDVTQSDIFLPKKRNLVCLVSDWRNFQRKAETFSNEELAEACRHYYSLIYSLLKKTAPSGNYYSDWTADELFIVFYEDGEVPYEKILQESLQFALELSTTAFDQTRDLFKGEHFFDIGMTTGEELIGLFGPENKRKVTVIGKSAGRAKRLEAEGKTIRETLQKPYLPPLLVFEMDLARYLVKNRLLREEDIASWKATAKNIEGKTVFGYCRAGLRNEIEKLPEKPDSNAA